MTLEATNVELKVIDTEILAQLGYVRMFALWAKRRLPRHVELDDLVSAGYLGLMHAARGFDGSKGAGFRTYASIRIQGAMRDYIRDENGGRSKHYTPPVQLEPEHLEEWGASPDFDREIQLREARARLAHVLNPREAAVMQDLYLREHSIVEVARRFGISPGRVSQIRMKSLAKLTQARASESRGL